MLRARVWNSAPCKAWLLGQPFLMATSFLAAFAADGRYTAAWWALAALAGLTAVFVFAALVPRIASPDTYSLPMRRLVGFLASGVDASLIPVLAYLVGLFAWVLNYTVMHVKLRTLLAAVTVPLAVAAVSCPAAGAITPPGVDPAAVPPSAAAGPVQPMAQRNPCVATNLLPGTDPGAPGPNQAMLNLSGAWKYSRGDGQLVAVIDTGVRPGPRLPNVDPGGDFVEATDGLSDCDGHGTLVAGLIAGQPGADSFSGVAPGARILSIRSTSARFAPRNPGEDQATARVALDVATLARAIVRAADLGARIINISAVTCLPANKTVDQTELGVGPALRRRAEGRRHHRSGRKQPSRVEPGFGMPVESTVGPRPSRGPAELGRCDGGFDPVVVAALRIVRRFTQLLRTSVRFHDGRAVGGDRGARREHHLGRQRRWRRARERVAQRSRRALSAQQRQLRGGVCVGRCGVGA